MLKNKLSEEKKENPVGTNPPLKLNTESSLDHLDELTPQQWTEVSELLF